MKMNHKPEEGRTVPRAVVRGVVQEKQRSAKLLAVFCLYKRKFWFIENTLKYSRMLKLHSWALLNVFKC